MTVLSAHPVAALFPRMDADAFAELKADIQAHGLREPILLAEGKIADGRNRYNACRELGIEPRFREWDGKASLVALVCSLNLRRRHLTSSQRAVVALRIEEHLAAEAKARQKRSPGRGKKVGKEFPTSSTNGKATDQAATIAGTNGHYVTDAKRIQADAPELVPRIADGELTIPAAKRELRRRAESKADECGPSPAQRVLETWRRSVNQLAPLANAVRHHHGTIAEATRTWTEADRTGFADLLRGTIEELQSYVEELSNAQTHNSDRRRAASRGHRRRRVQQPVDRRARGAGRRARSDNR